MNFIIRIATSGDYKYTDDIIDEMAISAENRGTGISRRTPEYIKEKMNAGLAVIAINPDNDEWAGFCCIEVWQHEKFVANSGLIVAPKYRGMGISKEIKIKLFELCRTKFPHARIFSLTTSPVVMGINKTLGYVTVPYSDILNDPLFLTGCNSWVNYVDLMKDRHLSSLYIAMVSDPVGELVETGTLLTTGVAVGF
ncbi:MAG: GNAT family N-acetyltransferase [Bacteroidetes bacterium]|nr:GNAT family N-acetyltransferase [Bacteroidota bacterium]